MGSNTEFVHMLDFLNKNKIKPIIDSVFPLSDIVQAHTQMEMFGHTGKIVLLNNLTDWHLTKRNASANVEGSTTEDAKLTEPKIKIPREKNKTVDFEGEVT